MESSQTVSSQDSTHSKSLDLSRDQRLRIRTLHFDANWTYQQITDELKITLRQVQHACQAETASPKKRSGRPRLLSKEQVDELVDFVCASKTNRQMSYLALSVQAFPEWGVSLYAIRSGLTSRGFKRCVAIGKPPLSEVNKAKRREFAEIHKTWTISQWSSIIWSDETWITGSHRKRWVTRRSGEEHLETCVFDKVTKRKGWMFWACFNGNQKGSCVFWEKEWGTITSESYCERILPLICGWVRLNSRESGTVLQLMQDNAKPHTANATVDELSERQIQVIKWPPYSPDLNPIENLWNKMKQWIQSKYGDVVFNFTYDRLREVVHEAWEQITAEDLVSLLNTMQQRCQDVIDAKGGHTKW
jgi:transposase